MTYLVMADPKFCSPREQQLLASLAAHLDKNLPNEVFFSPPIHSYFEKLQTIELSEALRISNIPSTVTILHIATSEKVLENVEKPVTWSSTEVPKADLVQSKNVLCHLGGYCEVYPNNLLKNRSLVVTTDKKLKNKIKDVVYIDNDTSFKDRNLLFMSAKKVITNRENEQLVITAPLYGCGIEGDFRPELQMFDSEGTMSLFQSQYKEAFKELNKIKKFVREKIDFDNKKTNTTSKLNIHQWLEEENTCLEGFLAYEKQKKPIKMILKVSQNIFLKFIFYLFFHISTRAYSFFIKK